jgi:hypothetical protein
LLPAALKTQGQTVQDDDADAAQLRRAPNAPPLNTRRDGDRPIEGELVLGDGCRRWRTPVADPARFVRSAFRGRRSGPGGSSTSASTVDRSAP